MPNRFDERKGGNNKMKKRMLSTLLTLGMLLTLTPAVLAEVPEGSAGDIPEETCKVEYKEQSDGIEIQIILFIWISQSMRPLPLMLFWILVA